jgi:hypothetical protein
MADPGAAWVWPWSSRRVLNQLPLFSTAGGPSGVNEGWPEPVHKKWPRPQRCRRQLARRSRVCATQRPQCLTRESPYLAALSQPHFLSISATCGDRLIESRSAAAVQPDPDDGHRPPGLGNAVVGARASASAVRRRGASGFGLRIDPAASRLRGLAVLLVQFVRSF